VIGFEQHPLFARAVVRPGLEFCAQIELKACPSAPSGDRDGNKALTVEHFGRTVNSSLRRPITNDSTINSQRPLTTVDPEVPLALNTYVAPGQASPHAARGAGLTLDGFSNDQSRLAELKQEK